MSGHSKWATTKRAKSITDAKKAKVFTKISKNLAVAARDGADPDMNPKLRLAIDQAKAVRMPKENIERAVAKGAGTGANAQQLESITYEGFGPGGVGIIIETVTDNKHRTAASIKHLFTKHGGNIGGSGSVAWQFDHLGVIYWSAETDESDQKKYRLTDDQEMALIEAGVVDIKNINNQTIIYTQVEDLEKIRRLVISLGLTEVHAALEWVPKDLIAPENIEVVTGLLEDLDDDDDVSGVYTNADV